MSCRESLETWGRSAFGSPPSRGGEPGPPGPGPGRGWEPVGVEVGEKSLAVGEELGPVQNFPAGAIVAQ